MPLGKQGGLEGVVAATTRLGRVDGEAGKLVLAGYAVEEIAPRASFEEMAHLLWYGSVPNARELQDLTADLASRRYALARVVEKVALRLLTEKKPGRRLDTNVEFYTALLLHGLGIPNELFTPTFAIGRVLGWTAHCLEQLRDGRLIRPESEYMGPLGLRFERITAQMC
jgi:citrate synthase